MSTSSSIDNDRTSMSSKMSASVGSLPKSTPSSNTTHRSRIPASLQAVFLSSNRGNDVHKPPPDAAASKTYFRNWLFQNKTLNSGGSLETSPKKDRKNRRNILHSFSEHLPSLSRNKNKNNKKGKTKASSDQKTTSYDKKHNMSKLAKEQPLKEPVSPSPKKKKKKVRIVSVNSSRILSSMDLINS